jgi:hypothetical protein
MGTRAFNFALERGAKTQHGGVASIEATPKFYREQSTEWWYKFFFLSNSQNLGDLNLLLCIIDNWECYKKKPELLHSKNLASLMLNTSQKIFTLAKFYGLQEHENSLSVLRNWLKTGDKSRFSQSTSNFRKFKSSLKLAESKL